ncbi:MAG: hypothetical protein NW214_15395 [Pseudanabaenaceae cyanobacterium bins.39]|nr:hypothetical protein [Pseudanabaenaceae cyanobacterium bins.39]
MSNRWVEGGSCCGKTAQMVRWFQDWVETDFATQANPQGASQQVLLIAIDANQSRQLSDRLVIATHGQYPVNSVTPLSFLRNEVQLFWTFLVKKLELKAQFPVLLRVENEQELALKCWQERLDTGILQMGGVGRDRLVRRLLDLFLLAVSAGNDLKEVPLILEQGLPDLIDNQQSQEILEALVDWRQHCWDLGLLTYGIVTDLFVQHLLPDPIYQEQLWGRFRYVMVDRADEMPVAIANLCHLLLTHQAQGIFSFNQNGSVRAGLGADPDYWQDIKSLCHVVTLAPAQHTLGASLTSQFLEAIANPMLPEPQPQVSAIYAVSRAKLFRNVADEIARAIDDGQVCASEIAIIAPGLDNIANYAITAILRSKNIHVTPLDDQRPLVQSAQVRSLLTLLGLFYPHLGNLISRDHIAEMLVVLTGAIDPVRAGMLADYCFAPHPDHPKLLPSDTYPQWPRLGYLVTKTYENLLDWLSQQSLKDAPLLFIDRAIQAFFKPRKLNYENIATLQSLIETAQYHWQLGYRLNHQEPVILQEFIEFIRRGVVTANPYPTNLPEDSVTLATIYQYRMARRSHRWQFWLDASSELWLQGGRAALFASPLFLKSWQQQPWTLEDQNELDLSRLRRLIADLLDRTSDRLYLCHSEFSTDGLTQNGILLPLLDFAT